MNCCYDKIQSILLSKAHIHQNGKASPHSSEDGRALCTSKRLVIVVIIYHSENREYLG